LPVFDAPAYVLWRRRTYRAEAELQNPGTPLGNYSITVTATSGSLNHSVQAALTVQ